MTVRFSTRCPNSDYLGFETSPEAIVAAAKKAEEVGFDAIFVNDHIIVDSSVRAANSPQIYVSNEFPKQGRSLLFAINELTFR